jgi:WD40 repeat protein
MEATVEVCLWDLTADGKDPTLLLQHESLVECLAFSSDGRLLASGDGSGVIKVFDLETHEVRALLRHPWGVTRLAFAPGRKELASAGKDTTVRTWVLDSEPEPRRLPLPIAKRCQELAFSPDGKVLATGEEDGTVRLWQTGTWSSLAELRGTARPAWRYLCLCFSPDSKMLAVTSDSTKVRLWEVPSGQLLHELPCDRGAPYFCAFAPDGRTLVTCGGPVRIWDSGTGQCLRALPRETQGAALVRVSPENKLLLEKREEPPRVEIWDLRSETLTAQASTTRGPMHCMAFSPDGRTLVTLSFNAPATFWEVATLAPRTGTPAYRPEGMNSVAFSPDGRTVAMGDDSGKVRLWNVATAQELVALDTPGVAVHSVAFSPDGELLAAIVEPSAQAPSEVYVWTAGRTPTVHLPKASRGP